MSAADTSSIAASIRRLGISSSGSARHIGTLVIAGEEMCLSVFEAMDARSVAAINESAGLPPDRIVEAEWIPGLPA